MSQFPRTYIIAEAGVNHNGSLDLARDLIDVAADAGVDAVKFQSFKAELSLSHHAAKAAYQLETTGGGETQLEMVKKLELGPEAFANLRDAAVERGLDFLSTPFDAPSLRLLVEDLGLRTIKIASGEITNIPLLWQTASSGCSVILSTGMSTLGEVERALVTLADGFGNGSERLGVGCSDPVRALEAYSSAEGQTALAERVILLHCTTEYPAPFAEVNLRALDTLRQAFGLPVGFSDHTEGVAVAVAAVARGAAIVEKHFTLDRGLPGPDHRASLEPDELAHLVTSIRQVEEALGSPRKLVTPSEFPNRNAVRKSIVARVPIHAGEVFTADNLIAKRPGSGLSPHRYWEILGRSAQRNYQPDELIEL